VQQPALCTPFDASTQRLGNPGLRPPTPQEGLRLALLGGRELLPPSTFVPARPGRVQPGNHALPDHLPLKLGHRREHADDEFPLTGANIEGRAGTIKNAQANVPRQKVLHQLQEMEGGAG
jgi:hypothetical protein